MTEKDVALTAHLLSKLEPGFLPLPIFEQIARIVALPILEYIPLKWRNETVEVLLLERPADDKHFAGMLHTPGTVIRATDVNQKGNTNWPAMERILNEELKGIKVGTPHYVGSIFHESKRGVEQAQLYWLEVLDKTPLTGTFYPVDNLPANFMDSQKDFVRAAASSFKKFKLS